MTKKEAREFLTAIAISTLDNYSNKLENISLKQNQGEDVTELLKQVDLLEINDDVVNEEEIQEVEEVKEPTEQVSEVETKDDDVFHTGNSKQNQAPKSTPPTEKMKSNTSNKQIIG